MTNNLTRRGPHLALDPPLELGEKDLYRLLRDGARGTVSAVRAPPDSALCRGGSLAPLRLKCEEVSQNLIRTTFFGLRTGPFELQVSAMKIVDLQAAVPAGRSPANVAPPVRGENDLYRLLVDGFQSSRNLLNSKVYDSLGIPAAGLAGPGWLSRRPGNFKRPQFAATSGSQKRLRF